jgi:NAD(P)-dependent dehydrogenase (short-subunit alcohol dehydrogenase family)
VESLDGKVVLVTGASSGLGEAAAVMAAQEGAKVVLAARREAQMRGVVDKINGFGGEAVCIRTDVTSTRDVEAMVAAALSAYGHLDCAVNNAGIAGPVAVPVADVSEEQWDEVMSVNLRSVWVCMKYEIPAMLARGVGSIVNVGSAYGSKPSPIGHAPYSTSKHALVGLTKTAAIDYAGYGLRVNLVAPGFAHSEMVDPSLEEAPEFMRAVVERHSAMNRLGEGHEIAAAITWLCSDAASFVNGSVLSVDGGDCTRMY